MHQYCVEPGVQVDLSGYETYYDGDLPKNEGKAKLKEQNKILRDLQELLYAEHRQKLLVVLQGIDTSGKDSTIRHVFGDVNPQGTKVM